MNIHNVIHTRREFSPHTARHCNYTAPKKSIYPLAPHSGFISSAAAGWRLLMLFMLFMHRPSGIIENRELPI